MVSVKCCVRECVVDRSEIFAENPISMSSGNCISPCPHLSNKTHQLNAAEPFGSIIYLMALMEMLEFFFVRRAAVTRL